MSRQRESEGCRGSRKPFASLILVLGGLLGLFWGLPARAQVPVSLAPIARPQFFDANGVPLAGGCVFSYVTGTTTPLATYADSTGTSQNANPLILDAGGFGNIWLSQATYRITVFSAGGTNCATGLQQWSVDGVSDPGFFYTTKAVLLAPAGAALQTIVGPLAANTFQQTTLHVTSSGVRVSVLDPVTTLDTALNPPTVTTTQPAVAGQNYTVPDPGTPTANFILNPNGTTNVLDCSQAGLTCKRTAMYYFPGGGCNNATSSLGWDTFGTNAPTPQCITGTNIQKGVLSLPSAVTPIQSNSGTVANGGTVTTTYPAATATGNLLIATIAFDGTHTITGCTDGTNAYSQAKHVANGALSVDVWYFGNAATKAAATVLTCTFNAGTSNAAILWHEYQGAAAAPLDQTISNTGTGTAVTTGTTAGDAQATELIFGFVGAVSNPTVAGGTGYTLHPAVSQSTNVTVAESAQIQNATGTFSTTYTLGSSQVWGAGIVTFKANVASSVIAQRTVVLPSFYNSAQAANANIKWVSPAAPTGTVNVVLGAAVACVADGATDDPAFNADTTGTTAVSTTGPNLPINTALNALTMTGCAASNTFHFQIKRLRYNTSDTFEGFVQVIGASLFVGITQ